MNYDLLENTCSERILCVVFSSVCLWNNVAKVATGGVVSEVVVANRRSEQRLLCRCRCIDGCRGNGPECRTRLRSELGLGLRFRVIVRVIWVRLTTA